MHDRKPHECKPVICPAQCYVNDYYVPRVVPYIHPIVQINRQNIVNVPEHIYQVTTREEIVDPGCPKRKSKHHHHHGSCCE